ncbi:MAG: thioredoxin family protein [Muribaculaceae bacterium]|nr:thioredoxin family protein [Muribaculaceae bacterium]
MKSQLEAALAGSKPVLIEFFASWCPHCKRMMPIMDELREKMGDRAAIIQIDVDKYPDLEKVYGVKGYPTFFVYKDGTQFWHDSGEKPLSELEYFINRVM